MKRVHRIDALASNVALLVDGQRRAIVLPGTVEVLDVVHVHETDERGHTGGLCVLVVTHVDPLVDFASEPCALDAYSVASVRFAMYRPGRQR